MDNTFDDFVAKVKRTDDVNPTGCQKNEKLMEELLGLAEEVGELIQIHRKNILYSREIEKEKVLSEMGDVLHYLVSIGQQYGLTLNDMIEHNITKVTKKWNM